MPVLPKDSDHKRRGDAKPARGPAILQIIPSLSAGGAERTTIDVAWALTAAGYQALVVSAGGRMEPELQEAGGELIRMQVDTKSPLAIFANAGRLAKLIRERNISLVHARSRAPAWSALLAARRADVPFVTTYHGIYNAKTALKRFYNSVMAKGDAVIANSEWTAAHIRRTHGSVSNLHIIPRGLDLEHFDPAVVLPARVARVRADWGATRDNRIVLLPGRLTRWKGQMVFLQALALLKKQGKLPANIRAVIAGDPQRRDSYRQVLNEAIVEYGLKDCTIIASHVEDMPAAYLASDIIVSASTDPEAFGRVPPEAGAMGKPIIATDHGGARETVLAGVSGLLIKPGDTVALAEALGHLLALPPAQLAAMGEAGRTYVTTRFTVERMCADTLAIYRELIGR